jgi:hypothetical protein
MKQIKLYILVLLLVVLVVPSVALAAWWNPLSWGIWNRVFHWQSQNQTVQRGNTGQTADWKTYSDSSQGISFKYPSTWTHQQANCNLYAVAFCPLAGNSPSNCGVTCSMNNHIPIYFYPYQGDVSSATAQDMAGWTKPHLALRDSKYKEIYDEMVSTFKFITPSATCTPNWQCGWGPCVKGSQSQVATDSNNCGLSPSSAKIACPALAKVCTTSNLGSITITTPNLPVNQVYAGQQATINFSGVQPSLCRSPTSCESEINFGGKDIEIGLGSWNFTVPQLSPGVYSVYEESAATGWKGDITYVTVLPSIPSIQPSIVVGLPAESACVLGKACNIDWQSTGITGNVSIILGGFVMGGDLPYTIATVPAATGSYSWVIPSGGYIPADHSGRYKIKICGLSYTGTSICGESLSLGIFQTAQ